jgi:phage gp36-like protein
MIFLTQTDFNAKISPDILNQITDLDNAVLNDAEASAIALITDAFADKYDLTVEFAKTADNRHKNLIRWLLNLTLYFIYERIPDSQVPERVVKNYDDTIKEIEMIERGKRATTLQVIVNPDTQRPHTVFRWGSQPPRSY